MPTITEKTELSDHGSFPGPIRASARASAPPPSTTPSPKCERPTPIESSSKRIHKDNQRASERVGAKMTLAHRRHRTLLLLLLLAVLRRVREVARRGALHASLALWRENAGR